MLGEQEKSQKITATYNCFIKAAAAFSLARDLQAFLLFSQHPTWLYHVVIAGKSIGNAVRSIG